MTSPIVFICGATGTQGGALAHHLLKKGVEIHAITRNLQSDAAQKLQSQGAFLAEGDFNNESILEKSMTNCNTLFLNLLPNPFSPTDEIEEAKQIISLAKRAGIKHLIYSAGLGTDQPERLRHWNPSSPIAQVLLAKQTVVNEVKKAGFEHWTILRPGNFMSNFLDPFVRMYPGLAETGKFTTVFTPETILPMVDPNDIGQFAAAAVLDPVRFDQKEVVIASQTMGVDTIMQELSRATGKEIKAIYLSEKEVNEQIPQNPLLGAQLLLLDASQFVDMEEVKGWNIDLGSFSQFLEREKERVQATYL